MFEGAVVILVVFLSFLLGPPVLIGLQGWVRDRARLRTLAVFRRRHAGVLVVNTERLVEVDPGLPPLLLGASVVRCLDATRYSLASLRALLGGEVAGITQNLRLTRDEALERLRAAALARGYDAILNVRFEFVEVATNAAEVMAYGTAIRRAR